MGIGKARNKEERAALARSWIYASTDAAIGKNQKREQFIEKVYTRFKSYAPLSAQAGRYASRSLESCRQKFVRLCHHRQSRR